MMKKKSMNEKIKRGVKTMEQNQDTTGWTTLTPGIWKPEEKKDSITGTLINKMAKTDQVSARYYIESDGKTYLIWGSAILDSRLMLVSVGTRVRITYLGMSKNMKGQDLKMYQVETACAQPETNTPEQVATIEDI